MQTVHTKESIGLQTQSRKEVIMQMHNIQIQHVVYFLMRQQEFEHRQNIQVSFICLTTRVMLKITTK